MGHTIEINPDLIPIFKEMCKRVRIAYDDVNFAEEEWYLQHTWTEKVEENFKKWLVKYLKKHRRKFGLLNLDRTIQKVADMFILNYGWKISDIGACND